MAPTQISSDSKKNGRGSGKAKNGVPPPIASSAKGKAPKGGSPLEGPKGKPLRKQTTIPGTGLTSGNDAIDDAALKAHLASVASSKAQTEATLAREHLRMLMGEASPPMLRVVIVNDAGKKYEFVEEPGKPQLKMRELKGEG